MPEQPPRPASSRAHLLTINVEEYFHVGSFEGRVRRNQWSRFEPRLDRNLDDVLELMARYGQTGTFFVLGCVAADNPKLVRRIVDAGHEVASRGYWPNGLRGMSPATFRQDLRRTRTILEDAGAGEIIGYRLSRTWLTEGGLWMLDVLGEEGYRYDSSINPFLRRFAGQPYRYRAHTHVTPAGPVRELPISTIGVMGLRLPISGGNYVRQFPDAWLRRGVEWWDEHIEQPLVFYMMPWEIDADQPHVAGLPLLMRMRHYRNLEKPRKIFERYFRWYKFQSIADYIGATRQATAAVSVASAPARAPLRFSTAPRQPVTLTIPMFNEASNVVFLHRALLELRKRLSGRYELHLVLVDDGSSDGTEARLRETFADFPHARIIGLGQNQGVAAAILAGIRKADTEIVCSIDCDCSYDPDQLEAMIPRLENADLVTASPYHPEGRVLFVSPWRLSLSKTLSRMYSLLLGERFYTYTSCCRVYRRSAVEGLRLERNGFIGVAELLIRLKLEGGRVVEHPATLESRLFGESKMKIVRTIWSHLGLLREVAARRIAMGWHRTPASRGATIG